MSTVTLHSEKKKSLVPKLRFPGFEGEWGNYSLKKIIVDLNSGISVNSDDVPIQNDLEVGILKTSCVANGIFKESENKKIVENEVSRAKLNPTKNEIIISRMNTPQLVGESGYIDRDYPSLFIPDRLWQTVVNQELCNSRWLSYFLITEKVRDNLKSIATGTSGTMKNISKPNFLSINVLIPTLPEQQKIASFLSVVDEKIQQLSRKKELLEQYKKGVMQQLFSGKLRFKDENGKDYPDWEKGRFSKYIKLYRGSSPRPIIKYVTTSEDGVNWIKIGDTKVAENYRISSVSEKITKKGSLKSRFVERGEIILANSMSFGKSYLLQIEGCIYDGWFVLREYEKSFDKEFLLQVLNSEFLQRQYFRLSTGGVVQNISSDIVYSTLLFCPSLPEQQKIANFLSGIDGKIKQVNWELVKTQEFKKGLLQQMFV